MKGASRSGKKHGRSDREKGWSKADEMLRYKDKPVVLDTDSDFIFIGRLLETNDFFITLADADVHDRRESPTGNEKYVMESRKYGIRFNRKLVHVRTDKVISFSSLEDVVDY